jgi:hypothetical protein
VPEIQLPPEEREMANVAFSRGREQMAIGITDRAVYVAEPRNWKLGSRWTQRRVPIEQVRRVTVRRTRPARIALLSLVFLVLGSTYLYVMILPFLDGAQRREVNLMPFILIGAGLVLPFVARGHRTVRIEFADGKPWVWKPPMFAADLTKSHVEWLIEQIMKGFRRQRIYVSEE